MQRPYAMHQPHYNSMPATTRNFLPRHLHGFMPISFNKTEGLGATRVHLDFRIPVKFKQMDTLLFRDFRLFP